MHEIIREAENATLRNMFAECGNVYGSWFEQLNSDISTIRSVLDLAGNFLDNATLTSDSIGRTKGGRS